MYLDAFSDNSFETNCWLIGADGTDDAVVVDPGFSPGRVRAMLEAEGKRPVAVLATHGHFDHIGAAAEFCGDDLPFYIHQADAMALTDPGAWGAGFATPPVPVKDVRTVAEGEEVAFAGFRIEVLHTPGHTPGSVCFVLKTPHGPVAFAGDTLFRRGIGRTDLWGGDQAAIVRSIKDRLYALDEATRVVTGHGPGTTIGEERGKNPFVRG